MQGEAVGGCLFITDLELVEVVEPAVRHLDNPAARLEALVLLGFDLFAACTYMRDVAMLADDGTGFFTDIADISAQVLRHGFGGIGLMNDLAVEYRRQLADIVAVGTDQRDAQRHALLIHQKMPPGAVFPPVCRVSAHTIGALNLAPSMACQRQPMPFFSS